MTRRHNCEAESNARVLSIVWRGAVLVTTWGCRRCPRQWETITDPAQIEADRLTQLREQVAASVARIRSERCEGKSEVPADSAEERAWRAS